MAAPMRMSSLFVNTVYRSHFPNNCCLPNWTLRAALHCSSSNFTGSASSKDIEELYIRPDVQTILKRITGFDLEKIFRKKPTSEISPPKYKLLTNDQLLELQRETEERGRELLQMPPVKNVWSSTGVKPLSTDTNIANFEASGCRYVFTDITYDLPHRRRSVVVREPDGVLRHADNKERDRILQVYFPRPGKMYRMPKMFQEDVLEKVLAEHRYEYILDRACNQFEPDDPDYIRVTQRTYEHISSHHRYDDLRSTRHFGPLSMYLAFYKKVDSLIVDMIQRDLLLDAEQLVRLNYIVHPTSSSQVTHQLNIFNNPQDLILLFIKEDAKQGGVIELALQSYNEAHRTESATQSMA